MPKTEEYKDANGKNRIRHTADNGNVTYASSQGYANLTDMRDSTINTAIALLEHYREDLSADQVDRLVDLSESIED